MENIGVSYSSIMFVMPTKQISLFFSIFLPPFSYTIPIQECSPRLSSAYLNPVFKDQLKFHFFHET